MKYIIEHLEPEVFEWCVLEYTHISEIVGKDNLIFTNVKDKEKLQHLGEVHSESIVNLNFPNMCILDPEAEEKISQNDCQKFDYLLFGGILGDYPMRKRTKQELSDKIKAEKRNIGKKQMSTNTAVYVVHEISKGKNDFDFQDDLIIPIEKGEEIILPYRYVKVNEKILVPKGFIEFVKKKGF
tara:strand:+ start:373 stop:921 length:549 start_codon:yes stop_codon:yes gene_type:complete